MTEKIVDLNKFKGLRNGIADERFELGDLATARNITVDDDGQAKRRDGYVKVLSGTPRSLWSDGTRAYFAEGTSLKAFYPDSTASTIGTLGSATAPVVYLKIGNRIYWTDSVATGVIEDATVRQWGLATPTMVVASATNGGLPMRPPNATGNRERTPDPATFGVTSTYVAADGQESGAPAMVPVTGTGISYTFTDSPPAGAVKRRVYITGPDGEVPFLVGEFPAATASGTYTSEAASTLPVTTQFCSPPPAGEVLAEFYGHILIASGQHLFWTLPFNYELIDYRTNVLTFNDPITILAPVNGGLFVATTTETCFLAGVSPRDWTKSVVAAYGGVKGTRAEAVGGKVGKGVGGRTQIWMSTEGVVAGNDNGNFVNLTLDRYSPVVAQSGTGFVRDMDGSYYYVTNLYY